MDGDVVGVGSQSVCDGVSEDRRSDVIGWSFHQVIVCKQPQNSALCCRLAVITPIHLYMGQRVVLEPPAASYHTD
ncbi:hypothetical protein J4Q44_G00036940 [Coregonus suidteri]|uniref:Uncharacterized protein n=1 Tax=Coregonus suidteri TaxID=861788 RepID=A0AAN8RED7_9TELE